jgi:hypothetical protein
MPNNRAALLHRAVVVGAPLTLGLLEMAHPDHTYLRIR